MRRQWQNQFWRHIDVNENNVKTFYILDLDKTLYDTTASIDVMRGVVGLHDTQLAAALERRFEEYERLGESFSMRDFIVEQVGEEEMRKIEVKFHDFAGTRDLLLPSARELIRYIGSLEQTACGILTYGSPLGQAMKIKAVADLEAIPFLVTSETYKGEQIATWRLPNGGYRLPDELGGMVAQSIVFVDDKPFSFKGLPIDCLGYLVKTTYDAGVEKIPSVVKPVSSLKEVIEAEKYRYAHPVTN